MKYNQSLINEYREMELVSYIQSKITAPLFYYFEVRLVDPRKEGVTFSDRSNLPDVVNVIMDADNLNIAIIKQGNINIYVGFDITEHDGLSVKDVLLIDNSEEVIINSVISGPDDGIDVSVANSNTRVYQDENRSGYYAQSIIDSLNEDSFYYSYYKNLCEKSSDIIDVTRNHNVDLRIDYVLAKRNIRER